ncbi:ABC transporter ATP-binding protein [Ferrimicrobium sp.]|uniref:ABC transporter ATP-binding protein n=1 Tax=Ferrimicrobium sp. TaxID=2926050 RepID=UPI0026351ECC|nr:ABC transporter ATP-binding protein [Ferrimicrobium sp.]
MTDVLLEVRGLHRSFGGVKALAGCTLDVIEGKINGLIGPNGSGKTTMFNIITGYERCDEGDVLYRGSSIRNRTPEAIFALGIGRTFQLTRIFGRLSVLDNMLVATQRNEVWLRSMLRPTGSASERAHAMELLDFVGLARLSGELAGSLSYGQRKLLELAYVLVADPQLILLDEPAGGVNPSLINQLSGKIAELNQQGTTFLVIEHNMEFVMGLCHAVTVMSYGCVIAAGTPEVVRADPKVLDAYLGGTEEDEDES